MSSKYLLILLRLVHFELQIQCLSTMLIKLDSLAFPFASTCGASQQSQAVSFLKTPHALFSILSFLYMLIM